MFSLRREAFIRTGRQDMSIDSAVSGSVIARQTCWCFVQAKRTHVSEGDTTRTTESWKIGLLREELREKFFVIRFSSARMFFGFQGKAVT